MASLEKFCLRWNDFETNVSQAFRELREEKDFFDVTLACEDEQLSAHKVILSACSPFFRNILRKNPHQHPLLYLKGVKHQEMLAVLNFMYMGEVNVAQEDLNSFLAVAEELRVKGLTQGEGTFSGKPQDRAPLERDFEPLSKEQRHREEAVATEGSRLPVKVEPPAEAILAGYPTNTAYGESEPTHHRSSNISSMSNHVRQSSNNTKTCHPEPIGATYACQEYAGQDYEEQDGEEEYSLGNGFTEDGTVYHTSGINTTEDNSGMAIHFIMFTHCDSGSHIISS